MPTAAAGRRGLASVTTRKATAASHRPAGSQRGKAQGHRALALRWHRLPEPSEGEVAKRLKGHGNLPTERNQGSVEKQVVPSLKRCPECCTPQSANLYGDGDPQNKSTCSSLTVGAQLPGHLNLAETQIKGRRSRRASRWPERKGRPDERLLASGRWGWAE